MKKLNFFFPTIMIFCLLFSTVKISAINYLITFSGSGASSVVESVLVQNITKGTSVIVPAGYNLRLTDTSTAIKLINGNLSELTVSPNPFTDHAIVTFFAKQAGNTQIDVFGLDGKKIMSTKKDLMTGNHNFGLDLPAGVYFIHLQGLGFNYTTKIISQAIHTSKAAIIYNGFEPSKSSPQKTQVPLETSMLYAANDHIIYKGISGIYATIVADVPTEDKNINFEFVGCTDANGNNYTITNVGGQIWMTENLRSTIYCIGGGTISQVSTMGSWSALTSSAYAIYENIGSNEPIYGKLYNGYAAINPNNICPCGWHVPTDNDWTIFSTNLGGDETAGAKLKITGTSFWINPNNGTNNVGFSALPAGGRGNLGYFGELGSTAYFMTKTLLTDPNYLYVRSIGSGAAIYRTDSSKKFGGSVRCLKD